MPSLRCLLRSEHRQVAMLAAVHIIGIGLLALAVPQHLTLGGGAFMRHAYGWATAEPRRVIHYNFAIAWLAALTFQRRIEPSGRCSE